MTSWISWSSIRYATETIFLTDTNFFSAFEVEYVIMMLLPGDNLCEVSIKSSGPFKAAQRVQFPNGVHPRQHEARRAVRFYSERRLTLPSLGLTFLEDERPMEKMWGRRMWGMSGACGCRNGICLLWLK
jgi:hypothetical protein